MSVESDLLTVERLGDSFVPKYYWIHSEVNPRGKLPSTQNDRPAV